MKPEPEAASRGPPVPYVIGTEDYYNVQQAAQIVGVSPATIHRWASHGSAPFGFDLDVTREPMIHHPRSFRQAKRHLETRMLIPATQVQALKQILRDCPRRPGPVSRQDMEALEAAARRYRSSVHDLSNSPSQG